MAIEEFRRHAEKRLDHPGPDNIRWYQVALLEDKKLAVGTLALRVSALGPSGVSRTVVLRHQ